MKVKNDHRKPWFFSGFFFPIAYIGKFTAMIILHFQHVFWKILRNEWYYAKVPPCKVVHLNSYTGFNQSSKLARVPINLVILNAVLNLPSWSWVLHSPNILSCTRTTKSKYCLQNNTVPIHKLNKKLAFNSDNSGKKIYKSYPRLLHFQLKL